MADNTQCISRAKVFGMALIGQHKRYLGLQDDTGESKVAWVRYAAMSFRIFEGMLYLILTLGTYGIYLLELVAILVGLYRTDANGRPVRWLTSRYTASISGHISVGEALKRSVGNVLSGSECETAIDREFDHFREEMEKEKNEEIEEVYDEDGMTFRADKHYIYLKNGKQVAYIDYNDNYVMGEDKKLYRKPNK